MERCTKTGFDFCETKLLNALNFDLGTALNRLAAYEDTGYEPEEIKSLDAEWIACLRVLNSFRASGLTPADVLRSVDLLMADKKGLCVVLPCKVGDSVYVIAEAQEIKEMKVRYLQSAPDGSICVQAECKDETEDCDCNGPCAVRFSAENMTRRKIFKTRAEAEAALGGMN